MLKREELLKLFETGRRHPAMGHFELSSGLHQRNVRPSVRLSCNIRGSRRSWGRRWRAPLFSDSRIEGGLSRQAMGGLIIGQESRAGRLPEPKSSPGGGTPATLCGARCQRDDDTTAAAGSSLAPDQHVLVVEDRVDDRAGRRRKPFRVVEEAGARVVCWPVR